MGRPKVTNTRDPEECPSRRLFRRRHSVHSANCSEHTFTVGTVQLLVLFSHHAGQREKQRSPARGHDGEDLSGSVLPIRAGLARTRLPPSRPAEARLKDRARCSGSPKRTFGFTPDLKAICEQVHSARDPTNQSSTPRSRNRTPSLSQLLPGDRINLCFQLGIARDLGPAAAARIQELRAQGVDRLPVQVVQAPRVVPGRGRRRRGGGTGPCRNDRPDGPCSRRVPRASHPRAPGPDPLRSRRPRSASRRARPPRQLREKRRNAPGSEVVEPSPLRLDRDARHRGYIDRTWRSKVSACSRSSDFLEAARYSSGTPSTISTVAVPRTSRAFASLGVLPTSIVTATSGRDGSARALGAVVAVQMTICSPFQWTPMGITRGRPSGPL